MFCKICDNLMVIDNNVQSVIARSKDESEKTTYNTETTIKSETEDQEGGGDKIKKVKKTKNVKEVKEDTESSDYNVSSITTTSKRKKTAELSKEDIENILSGRDADIELSDYVIEDIIKNSTFKHLDDNQKVLLVNKLYEYVDTKVKTKQKTENVYKGQQSFFLCKNCGYHEKIPNRTQITSRSKGIATETNLDVVDEDTYKYDPTIPKTRNYKCLNKDCETHKNPMKKYASFKRIGKSLVLKYVCHVCKFKWQTK